MTTIDGKQIVFQTTLALQAKETAVVSTPAECGFEFTLNVGALGEMPKSVDEMERKIVQNRVSFDVPHLPNKYVLSSEDDLSYQGKSVRVRVTAHGVSDHVLLHLQCQSLS